MSAAVSIQIDFKPLRPVAPVVHRKALCEGWVGAGSVVDEYAYVSVNAEIGPNCYVGPCTHVDGVLGDGVVLERGVLVGTGVRIGDGAVVRAGSMVFDDVAPHSVAAGSPARRIA